MATGALSHAAINQLIYYKFWVAALFRRGGFAGKQSTCKAFVFAPSGGLASAREPDPMAPSLASAFGSVLLVVSGALCLSAALGAAPGTSFEPRSLLLVPLPWCAVCLPPSSRTAVCFGVRGVDRGKGLGLRLLAGEQCTLGDLSGVLALLVADVGESKSSQLDSSATSVMWLYRE